MGACQSTQDSEEEEKRKRSRAIDARLEEDSRRLRKECKILLLGSGESGKSTIVKQMKIIHQNGYTRDELALYRLTIYKNLLDCAKALINAMRQFDIEPRNTSNIENAEFLLEYSVDPDPHTPLDPHVGECVETLWHDPCVEDVMQHQSEFYLMDSAPYFFEEVRRISSPHYIPTESDVLRARTKTTGIYETRFTMGQLSIHMFDVGGQRSERKKWIHCFENVTSIIFCVALSEYDQVLLENADQNRMMESLVLFDSVVNSRWFMRTSIILFLNKVDLFKGKLERSPLSKYFTDYSGGNDVNRAAKYLLWRFNQVNRAHLNLYPQRPIPPIYDLCLRPSKTQSYTMLLQIREYFEGSQDWKSIIPLSLAISKQGAAIRWSMAQHSSGPATQLESSFASRHDVSVAAFGSLGIVMNTLSALKEIRANANVEKDFDLTPKI